MAFILHPPKTMTPHRLRNALRMALAGLSMRINRFTPDDAAERAARIAPRPPPCLAPLWEFFPLCRFHWDSLLAMFHIVFHVSFP